MIDSAPFSQTWVGGLYKAVKLAGVNGLLSFSFLAVPADFFNNVQVHPHFLFLKLSLESLDILLISGLDHPLRTSFLDGIRTFQLD